MTPFPVILGKQQRCRNSTVLQVGRCRDCLPDYLQVVVLKCGGRGSPLRRRAALAGLAWARHRGRLGHKEGTNSSVSASAASVRADASHFCCRTNLVDAGAFLDRTTWKWALGCSVNPNVSEALFLILAFVQEKKYIPGLAWLQIITAHEQLHGTCQRCPKQFRAVGQQIPLHLWWKLDKVIARRFQKSACTWTELTLLCFLAFPM